MDFNRVFFIGNLTRDPESRTASTGTAMTTFSIAVNERRGGGREEQNQPLYLRVKTFGKTAEIAAKYLVKGSNVLVEGRLEIDEYESRDGQKRRDPVVVANNIQLGPRPRGGDAAGEAPESYGSSAPRSSYRDEQPDYRRDREAPPRREEPRREVRHEAPIDDPGGTEDDLPF
jgi:single-strand DNA-binding protein